MRTVAAVALLSSFMLGAVPGTAGPPAEVQHPQCLDEELVLDEPGPRSAPTTVDFSEPGTRPGPTGVDTTEPGLGPGPPGVAVITVPDSWEELTGVDSFVPIIDKTPCGHEALTLITFAGGETIMTAAGATDVQVDGRHIHVTLDPNLNRRLERKAARMSRKR
ncbi:MAG: hypothetical protein M3245_06730 [Actinomycetota bacterium]|nr:hypothetical protein [Actinomycetota bacterium]